MIFDSDMRLATRAVQTEPQVKLVKVLSDRDIFDMYRIAQPMHLISPELMAVSKEMTLDERIMLDISGKDLRRAAESYIAAVDAKNSQDPSIKVTSDEKTAAYKAIYNAVDRLTAAAIALDNLAKDSTDPWTENHLRDAASRIRALRDIAEKVERVKRPGNSSKEQELKEMRREALRAQISEAV